MKRRKTNYSDSPDLVCITRSKVRFSEVDSMKVVWHGNYAKYLEDGREAFGKEYAGLAYMDMYDNGCTAPIVEMNIEYLTPLRFGDEAEIETRYIDSHAAKLRFEYIIRRVSDGQTAARGYTVQVFLDGNDELCLTLPPFVENWKKRWLK